MHFFRRKLFVVALVIVAILVPVWPGFDKPGLPMEEGALLVYPELILKGNVPYRDFETFYGPANLWILSSAYAAFGPGIGVERTVGLVYRFLILGGLFVLIQRWSATLAAGCTFLAGFVMIPIGIAAYAWLGALMCALWSLWMITSVQSVRRCFVGGILGALALLFRPDLAPAVIASSLPLFLLMPKARRWNYLGGVATGMLPLIGLTIFAGPGESINNLFLFPVFHSSTARHLPLFSTEQSLICLFFVHLGAVGTNIVAGVIAIRGSRQDPFARLLLGLGLLALGLTHQAAQRLDFGHLVSALVLSVSVLPLSIFIIQSHWRNAPARPHHAALALAIVSILLMVVAPKLTRIARDEIITSLDATARGTNFVEHRGRSFPVGSARMAFSLDKALRKIESQASPTDRLFVGPADLRRTNYNDTFIYYLMPQLRPATYFLEMNPQSANRPNSRLAADIANANWLLLTHQWDSWNEPNESVKFGSDAPMRVVQSQFELCGRYDSYEVYRRRAAVALSR
jgi:hypothetical protein